MNIDHPNLRLLSASENIPEGLEDTLKELGAGDSRFRGTSFGRGECSLDAFLQECRDADNPAKLSSDRVPQTTFWLVDQSNRAVGIVRVRHRLNERLSQYGGHIGYYIRPQDRGKGYGKAALRLALNILQRLGVSKALITVHPSTKSQKGWCWRMAASLTDKASIRSAARLSIVSGRTCRSV